MSNTYRLVCTHHTPRIYSDDLGPIRVIADLTTLYAHRADILEAIGKLDSLGLDTHNLGVDWQKALVRFFRQHPTCALAMASDTGRESPLNTPEPDADDDETPPARRPR